MSEGQNSINDGEGKEIFSWSDFSDKLYSKGQEVGTIIQDVVTTPEGQLKIGIALVESIPVFGIGLAFGLNVITEEIMDPSDNPTEFLRRVANNVIYSALGMIPGFVQGTAASEAWLKMKDKIGEKLEELEFYPPPGTRWLMKEKDANDPSTWVQTKPLAPEIFCKDYKVKRGLGLGVVKDKTNRICFQQGDKWRLRNAKPYGPDPPPPPEGFQWIKSNDGELYLRSVPPTEEETPEEIEKVWTDLTSGYYQSRDLGLEDTSIFNTNAGGVHRNNTNVLASYYEALGYPQTQSGIKQQEAEALNKLNAYYEQQALDKLNAYYASQY